MEYKKTIDNYITERYSYLYKCATNILLNNKRAIEAGDLVSELVIHLYENEQKTLLKALNMYRDSCNVFIGCIPKFVELDKQIQRLCKIRITILFVILLHR